MARIRPIRPERAATAMKIVVSGDRLERELVANLQAKITKRGEEILTGVPTAVYEVRCAELRILRNFLAELPEIVKKARE